MLINFGSPTQTLLDFSPINQGLIFDDLDISEFATEEEAIAALGEKQIYKLAGNQVVKVTPPTFTTNLIMNLSKAFTWFRRVF